MMNMQNLLGAMGGAGMRGGRQAAPNPDDPKPDTAEQIHISSLALLKMLKHCEISNLLSSRRGPHGSDGSHAGRVHR